MKYLRLELNGYTRFALNEIGHFNIVFTAPLQLIIGTNGSGKSSLLEQLTPLPAHQNDFTKTGSKIIEIEHRHRRYVLSSKFFPKPHHSFKVDDEPELNEGGTGRVQLDLVKEHFGLTPEIHQLLLGRETFHAMSAPRRKDWFLKLCDTNYDYAIRQYNKAKEQQRDTSGALKLAKKTLVQESEKLLGDDELNRYKSEVEGLHRILSELLELRKPIESDLTVLDFEQDKLDRTLVSLAKALEALQQLVQGNPLSIDDYDRLIVAEQESIVKATALIDKASNDFEKNDVKIKLLQKAEAKSIEALELEVQTLSQTWVALLDSSLLGGTGLAQARAALTVFEALKQPLSVVFAEIPENTDRQYSSGAMQEARTKIHELTQLKSQQSQYLEKTLIGIKHMETHRDHPDLQCPKCAHQFSAQYNEAKYHGLLEDQAQRQRLIHETYEPQLAQLEDFIVRCAEYGQHYRSYVQLTQSSVALKPYWDLLEAEEVVRHCPRAGIHWLHRIEADLHKQVDAQALQQQLVEKRELIRSLKQIGSADLKVLLEQNQALEEQLNTLTATLQTATRQKAMLTDEQQRMRQFVELRRKMRAVFREKRRLGQETRETLRRMELNKLIRALQSELAVREAKIGSAQQQKNIVDNLAKRIDEYAQQEQGWAILVKELSPTEGLIAEGLLGFMKNFIDQMNRLIDQVWSYQLEVQSCEVLEGNVVDLDYRFPMKLQGRTEPVPDVSAGSTGIIEMVNLAFKMTAMQYLHLQDSALYLDEAGGAFDEVHRLEIAKMIKTLVEQQTFPQVFLISHYFELYGGFSNLEMCMLSSLNVAAPTQRKVNQHVILTT